MKKQCLLLATLLSSQLMAQPFSPVVELNSSGYSDTKKKPSASDIQRAEQFYQMQVLKDEVKMLRGKVEELSYQLQQLKQLQMDDYLDIDRRLTAISASKATLIPTNNTIDSIFIAPDSQLTAQTLQPEVSAPIIVTPEDIEEDYLASSKLLKERDFEGAIAAFKNHILNFEQSPYSANAHYWLGEIYEFRGEAELAMASFEVVINSYSAHNKAMDARYKLGKLYHKQGDSKRAIELLKEAAQTNGGAGAKAKAYLKAKGL
ncbi:MAG: YbgF trimerization domain-containing protein [Porticoccaceae bacterium]|nr:YbgF trimerization domain-containing protein [Porticoccaceae bacterium]